MRFQYKEKKLAEINSRLNDETIAFGKMIKEITFGFKQSILKHFIYRYNVIFNTQIDFKDYNIVWDGVLLTVESSLRDRIIFVYGPNGAHVSYFYRYKKPHVEHRLYKFWEDPGFRYSDISDEKYPHDIPPDPLFCILRFLPIRDLLNCRPVSKHWNRVVSMNRTWGVDFKDFIKGALLLNDLNVENTLVKDVNFAKSAMMAFATAWAFENHLNLDKVTYYYVGDEEEERKTKKMKILRNTITTKFVTTRMNTRTRVFMAGMYEDRAVCWITPEGELKMMDTSLKLIKKNLKERLHNINMNYLDFIRRVIT